MNPLPSRLKSMPLTETTRTFGITLLFLYGGEQAAGDRKQQRNHPIVDPDHVGEFACAVFGRPSVARQGVVKDRDAARAEQADARRQVLGVSDWVRVTEHEVVR